MSASRSVRISAVLGAATVAGLGLGVADAQACTTTPPPHNPCSGTGAIPDSDVQYQTPGSAAWTDGDVHAALKTEPAGGKVNVRINPRSWYASAACTRDISLASYSTDGPTWATSGEQVFVGYDTAELTSKHPTATLTVPLPGAGTDKPTCWGQVDLYFGTTIFDGKTSAGHGPLPHYPNGVFPNNLLSWWNGGTGPCEVAPPPTPPPTTEPTSTKPPTTKPTTEPPTTTTSAPPTTTTSTTSTPPSSTPTTPVTPTPTSTTGTTSAPPATSTPGTPTLAHTGSNAAPLAAGAAGLIGVGGAVMFSARRVGRRH